MISFTTESAPRPRTAHIYAIDPRVDLMTRTVTIRALYNNADGKIIPGMMARIFVGQKSGNTLQIPTEAIVPDADQMAVWIVQNGAAHARNVITGIRSEDMIEIRSGLMQGDSVVTTGLLQVREGSPLLINNPVEDGELF
jgi:membrane fusion protein (multidrug efflux system)